MKKINKKIVISSAVSVLLALPAVIWAFTAPVTPSTTTLSDVIDGLLNILWTVAVVVVIVVFILTGILFLTARGEPDKIKQARDAVVWGTVGTAVILISASILLIVRGLVGV